MPQFDLKNIDKTLLLEINNGFIRAMLNSMETMVYTKVNRVNSYLKEPKQEVKGEVTGVISFFGDLYGTCALSFPRNMAIRLVSKMLMDDDVDDLNDIVKDGIAEIANLVAGSGKSELAGVIGTDAKFSLPAVIVGKDHFVDHDAKVPCIVSVFEECGEQLTMELSVYRK